MLICSEGVEVHRTAQTAAAAANTPTSGRLKKSTLCITTSI